MFLKIVDTYLIVIFILGVLNLLCMFLVEKKQKKIFAWVVGFFCALFVIEGYGVHAGSGFKPRYYYDEHFCAVEMGLILWRFAKLRHEAEFDKGLQDILVDSLPHHKTRSGIREHISNYYFIGNQLKCPIHSVNGSKPLASRDELRAMGKGYARQYFFKPDVGGSYVLYPYPVVERLSGIMSIFDNLRFGFWGFGIIFSLIFLIINYKTKKHWPLLWFFIVLFFLLGLSKDSVFSLVTRTKPGVISCATKEYNIRRVIENYEEEKGVVVPDSTWFSVVRDRLKNNPELSDNCPKSGHYHIEGRRIICSIHGDNGIPALPVKVARIKP